MGTAWHSLNIQLWHRNIWIIKNFFFVLLCRFSCHFGGNQQKRRAPSAMCLKNPWTWVRNRNRKAYGHRPVCAKKKVDRTRYPLLIRAVPNRHQTRPINPCQKTMKKLKQNTHHYHQWWCEMHLYSGHSILVTWYPTGIQRTAIMKTCTVIIKETTLRTAKKVAAIIPIVTKRTTTRTWRNCALRHRRTIDVTICLRRLNV